MKRDLIVTVLAWSVLAAAFIFIILSIINSGEIALYNFLGSLFAAASIPLVHYYRKLKDKRDLENEY